MPVPSPRPQPDACHFWMNPASWRSSLIVQQRRHWVIHHGPRATSVRCHLQPCSPGHGPPYLTSKGFLLQRKSLSVQRHAEGFLQEAGPVSPALCGWEQDVMEGLLSLRPHPAWKGCRGERQGSLESIWGQPWQEVQM